MSKAYPDVALMTAPASFPVYDAFNIPREKYRSKQSYEAYKNNDAEKLLKNSKKCSYIDQEKIAQHVDAWINEGYQGEANNPSQGGLIALLKQSEDVLMALDAIYVLHEKGVVSALETAGFKLEPMVWNQLDKMEEDENLSQHANKMN